MRSASPNVLGILGFAFSLLGLLTCGLLAPFGLVLSAAGLLRPRRRLAVAGTLISGLATLWLLTVAAAVVAGVSHLKPQPEHVVRQRRQAETRRTALTQAANLVRAHQQEQGEWPDERAGEELIAPLVRVHDTPLKYTRAGELALLISAGADGRFATADDLSLDPAQLSPHKPPRFNRFRFSD